MCNARAATYAQDILRWRQVSAFAVLQKLQGMRQHKTKTPLGEVKDFAIVVEESATKATAYFAVGGQKDQAIPVGGADT